MSYKIGELARITGMTVEGLRFYERRGLLAPARRTRSGYRLYERPQIERLGFIAAAQRMGFSLAEILELLQLKDGGEARCVDVRARLQAKLAAVEDRRRLLDVFAGQLEDAIARCDQQLAGADQHCCPVLDDLGDGLRPTTLVR